MEFSDRLAEAGSRIEATLETLLADAVLDQEIARPPVLVQAMRYSALGGGKRLRPFLFVEAAAMFGADRSDTGLLRAACALELIHCYSLVHDDLPAMDDDELRRGKPTTHRAFDEATAILAGDALLTYAFDVLADAATHGDPAVRAELVLGLARAAGLGGMAGGQMLDLQAETAEPAAERIALLQAMKTGALLRFGCEGGAIFAGAGRDDRARLKRFGEIIGRAFQLADDLLDVTATAEQMGKTTGKDADRGKATMVALLGVENSRAQLDALVAEAGAALGVFGERAAVLLDTARFVATRGH